MSRSSDTAGVRTGVDDAVAAFGSGDPVLIHDAADREGEVDLVHPAAAVAPADVARMRNDAGGLVCVALPDDVCDAWGLPFAQSTLSHPAAEAHDLAYGDRSSFSITVNHRDTFTGVTDEDRALTISALGEALGAGSDGAAGPVAGQRRRPTHRSGGLAERGDCQRPVLVGDPGEGVAVVHRDGERRAVAVGEVVGLGGRV